MHRYWLKFKKYETLLSKTDLQSILLELADKNQWKLFSAENDYLIFKTNRMFDNAQITIVFQEKNVWINCRPCVKIKCSGYPGSGFIFWFRGEYYKEIKNSIREREKMMGKPNNQ